MWKGIITSGGSHCERIKLRLLNIQKLNPLRWAFLPSPHNNGQMNVTFYRIPAGHINVSGSRKQGELTVALKSEGQMWFVDNYPLHSTWGYNVCCYASSGRNTVLTQICSSLVLWMWASGMLSCSYPQGKNSGTPSIKYTYQKDRASKQVSPSQWSHCKRIQTVHAAGFITHRGLTQVCVFWIVIQCV